MLKTESIVHVQTNKVLITLQGVNRC